jgi:hypothetical protein
VAVGTYDTGLEVQNNPGLFMRQDAAIYALILLGLTIILVGKHALGSDTIHLM